MIKAVVGANWGDEGKGKITDMLAKRGRHYCPFPGWCECRPYHCKQLWKVCTSYPSIRRILQPHNKRNRKRCCTQHSGSDQRVK